MLGATSRATCRHWSRMALRLPHPATSFQCRAVISVWAKARPGRPSWRPSLDDVQRLSEGKAAKTRGAGSRQVPHRLNAEEVKLFKLAKEKGFVTLKGSGYRRERKGSPLANIYRQWCDALGAPCVLLEQDATGDGKDTVLVDLAPLRGSRLEEVEAACLAAAAELGCGPADPAELQSPFTLVLPTALVQLGQDGGGEAGLAVSSPEGTGVAHSRSRQAVGASLGSELAAATGSDSDAAVVAGAEGSEAASYAPASATELEVDNSARSLQLSESSQPGGAVPLLSGPAAAAGELADELMRTAPIWRQPPRLLGFKADRSTAKALGKALGSQLVGRRS